VRAWDSGQAAGVYNFGSGVAISHREIAERVVRVARDAGFSVQADAIRTVPVPAALRGKFQFYTRSEDVLPWVSEYTAEPLEKMARYWTDLATAARAAR
jgi:hypothetical protein